MFAGEEVRSRFVRGLDGAVGVGLCLRSEVQVCLGTDGVG